MITWQTTTPSQMYHTMQSWFPCHYYSHARQNGVSVYWVICKNTKDGHVISEFQYPGEDQRVGRGMNWESCHDSRIVYMIRISLRKQRDKSQGRIRVVGSRRIAQLARFGLVSEYCRVGRRERTERRRVFGIQWSGEGRVEVARWCIEATSHEWNQVDWGVQVDCSGWEHEEYHRAVEVLDAVCRKEDGCEADCIPLLPHSQLGCTTLSGKSGVLP